MGLLRVRHLQPEVMDQPNLNPDSHRRALSALARINYLSRTAGSFFQPLLSLQSHLRSPRLRILDLATGGGDVAVRLWHMGLESGRDWRIAGCDISPVAVEHARRQALNTGAEVHFFVHDVLNKPLPEGYDVILSSLFLHHLKDVEVLTLFERVASSPAKGPKALLINDLNRGLLGLGLACVVPRLLTLSPIVHTDAVRSVRAAYSRREMLSLAEKAGLKGVQIRRCWPCRWFLQWSRP